MAEMYYYNGVKLPKLPEWDKTTYPYAVIVAFPDGGLWTYAVTFFNALGYVSSEPISLGRYAYVVPGGVTYKDYRLYIDEPDVWNDDFLSGPYEAETAFLVGWPEAPEAGIIWSSVDIVNEDGSLHHAASAPVPVNGIDHTAIIQGWLVGKRLAAMRGKKKPVAYLYNGVRLPELPKTHHYNETGYAFNYSVIYHNSFNGKWQLIYFTHPLKKYLRDVLGGQHCLVPTEIPYLTYSYTLNDENVWKDDGAFANPGYFSNGAPWITDIDKDYDVIWADHDIMDIDNSKVWLAKSEPVPVYE